jgi:cyanophycinase
MWFVLAACTPDAPQSRPEAAPGVVVLAGGGSEGDLGDETAWSARLYRELLSGGDVTGDDRVVVAVLSTLREDEWLLDYFAWLGADEATNVFVPDREAAEGAPLDGIDAVFLKGGDQGWYYDEWNDTALERGLRRVRRDGGGVGGTSAGAMSMAGVALAGGEDLVSADVLGDACTRYLDDASDGGSGLHDDFLAFLPGLVVDTHVTVRGRLGRMVGTLARAVDDGEDVRGVLGLDERTGLVVDGDEARVVGVGAVKLVTPSAEAPVRACGRPLAWAGLGLDVLVDGWSLRPSTLEVTPGPRADLAPVLEPAAEGGAGDWWVDGDVPSHEARFGWVVDRYPRTFDTHPGTASVVLPGTVGIVDAHDTDRRGPGEEALLAALAAHPGASGFLVGAGGRLERTGRSVVYADGDRGELATLVVDAGAVSAVDQSPEPSTVDDSFPAAGLQGLGLHVLSTSDDRTWDTVTHTLE